MTSSGTRREYVITFWSGRRQPGMVAAPARATEAAISFTNVRREPASSSLAPLGNSRSTHSRNSGCPLNSSTLRQ